MSLMQATGALRAAAQRPGITTLTTPVVLANSRNGRRFAGRNSVGRHMRNAEKETEKLQKGEPSAGSQMMDTAEDMRRAGSIPIFPGTFVSLPLSRYPRRPSDFVQYQYHRTKSWLTTVFMLLQIKLESMGKSWTTRPQFKAHKGQIAPTAKIMYRELLEAFAAEDRATIKKLCTPAFAEKFIYAIEQRKKNERVHWELVRYNQPLLYPKLLSYLVASPNPRNKTMMVEQAVVAISSEQKAHKTNKSTGDVIPGSLKEQDSIEYVVMWRHLNGSTWDKSPWTIWGTTGPSTLDKVIEQNKNLDKQQAKLAGWKTD